MLRRSPQAWPAIGAPLPDSNTFKVPKSCFEGQLEIDQELLEAPSQKVT